jgi:hypothetical protein
LLFNQSSRLDHVKVIRTRFNFKLRLSKKSSKNVFFSISSSVVFYRSGGFPLDKPSWLGHISTTLTWFNFKLRLVKKSVRKFFPVNFILFLNFILRLFYQLIGLLLSRLSWLGHIEPPFTWFNFKIRLGNELDHEVLKLSH